MEIDGRPWFVAKDVCFVLGPAQVTWAPHPLGEDEKGLDPIKTPGGIQRLNTINESGHYKLIMRSDKPVARHLRN